MGHLGHSPVAWAEATWPVAGPSIGQVRQQVPLTGRTELHGFMSQFCQGVANNHLQLNKFCTFGKAYNEEGSLFPEGLDHEPLSWCETHGS